MRSVDFSENLGGDCVERRDHPVGRQEVFSNFGVPQKRAVSEDDQGKVRIIGLNGLDEFSQPRIESGFTGTRKGYDVRAVRMELKKFGKLVQNSGRGNEIPTLEAQMCGRSRLTVDTVEGAGLGGNYVNSERPAQSA
jgi:hypothetical protein